MILFLTGVIWVWYQSLWSLTHRNLIFIQPRFRPFHVMKAVNEASLMKETKRSEFASVEMCLELFLMECRNRPHHNPREKNYTYSQNNKQKGELIHVTEHHSIWQGDFFSTLKTSKFKLSRRLNSLCTNFCLPELKLTRPLVEERTHCAQYALFKRTQVAASDILRT